MKADITIKNTISEIRMLQDETSRLAEAASLPTEIVSDIKIILEEAVSNIIFYGFEDDAEHEIRVNLTVSTEIVSIRIEDSGKPFNPLEFVEKKPGKPLEEYEDGGMGLILIKALTDEIEYAQIDGKNVLLMKKKVL